MIDRTSLPKHIKSAIASIEIEGFVVSDETIQTIIDIDAGRIKLSDAVKELVNTYKVSE